ncbi:MAG: SLC13 family permease [Nitrospirae bacterium]|nr:SLC13 family permease [Nitrospirota bacterium]
MEIALVLGILAFAVLLFSLELLPIEVVSLTVMLLLVLTGVLSPGEAFAGFGNEALIMIAGILVLTGGLLQSGVADKVGHSIYALARRNHQRVLLILLTAVCSISAFINNVAATAMMMPAAMAVARKTQSAPSRFLMPIAFASMMGGTCTLIGTSTNLAVSGMLPQYQMAPLTLFELTPLGVTVSIVGILYFALVGYRLLPDRRGELVEEFHVREYLTEVIVLPHSHLVGKRIEESRLGGELEINIVGVFRDGDRTLNPERGMAIRSEDILLVEGKAEEIHRILEMEGLKIKGDVQFHDKTLTSGQVKMVELSIPNRSDLVGKTLKEVNFRRRYGLNALAIYRRGESLLEKVGRVVLQFGDVLLVHGEKRRIEALRENPDFILLGEVTPYRRRVFFSGPDVGFFPSLRDPGPYGGLLPPDRGLDPADVQRGRRPPDPPGGDPRRPRHRDRPPPLRHRRDRGGLLLVHHPLRAGLRLGLRAGALPLSRFPEERDDPDSLGLRHRHGDDSADLAVWVDLSPFEYPVHPEP